MIELYAVAGNPVDKGESNDQILQDWELTSLNGKEIKIKLTFVSPLKVSQGDSPDLLMVQLSMSEFKDAMGKNLPETVLKVLKIPRQLLSANEKARIK